MEAYVYIYPRSTDWLADWLTHLLISPHNALVSYLKIVPWFRACFWYKHSRNPGKLRMGSVAIYIFLRAFCDKFPLWICSIYRMTRRKLYLSGNTCIFVLTIVYWQGWKVFGAGPGRNKLQSGSHEYYRLTGTAKPLLGGGGGKKPGGGN